MNILVAVFVNLLNSFRAISKFRVFMKILIENMTKASDMKELKIKTSGFFQSNHSAKKT